jgi:hypothetical protein
MARITHIRGDDPNDNMREMTLPGYSLKRGKIVPDARPAWGAKDGNGASLDTERGKQLLDEALGE